MKAWQRLSIGILIGVLLVGGLLFFLLRHSAVQTTRANGTSPQGTPNLEQIERSLDVAWIHAYRSEIQQEVAQGLGASVNRVQTQLHAGETMSQVGAAQGLTPAGLQALELRALRDAGQLAVRAGAVSQAHLDQFLRVAQSDPVYLEQIIRGIFIKDTTQ